MRIRTLVLPICLVGLGGCGSSGAGNAGEADAAAEGSVILADATQGEGGSEQDGEAGPGATDAAGSPPDAGGSSVDAANDVLTDARSDAASTGDAGGSACGAASDCRKFSDYCGGCNCLALGARDPDPACDAGTVSCFVDPCSSHTAACGSAGRCVLQ